MSARGLQALTEREYRAACQALTLAA